MNRWRGLCVRMHMLWAALLLASASPSLPATASPREDLAATARTFKVDVGRASVTVTLDVDAVGRPSRVPVRVQALPRDGSDDARESLTVFLCDDLRCTLRSEATVPLDGVPVVLDAALFPSGLALALRHAGSESQCCSTTTLGRNTPAVATTEPAGGHVDVVRDGDYAGGLVVTPAGAALLARPALLDAFDALIVQDEGWHIGGVADPRNASLVTFVNRGGVASVPASFFGAATTFTDAPQPPAVDVTLGGARASLLVPDGTKLLAAGDGHYVVRPLGATREQQLAGLLAVRPDLLLWTAPYGQGDSVAMRAVGAGLATRPHRGLAFLIGCACVVGVALCVRTTRRRGWRAALVTSAGVAFAGLSLLWLVERASVPSETHTRVVAWVGPHASWEIGVDAIRPRTQGEVTVSSPVMPVMATVLGDGNPPREPKRSVHDTGIGETEWLVTSTVDSASALAVTWERAAPTRTPAVERKGDVVTNHLDVPLRAITTSSGNYITGALTPHASRSVKEFATVSSSDEAQLDLSPMEQRLLNEISEGCRARLRPAASYDAQANCGAAIAVLDDGTLLGIEVSP